MKRFLIGLACLLGLSGPAAADLLWGANGHPFNAYPGISITQQLDYLEDLGMKSYRVNISDTGAMPELAALVAAAKGRGIEILPVITPGNVDLDKDSPQELYKKAYALATALASPLKNDIRVWELGNEMENYAILQPCDKRDDGSQYPCSWGPASGNEPTHYQGARWAKVSAVLKGLSEGIASVDPTIRRAMGTAGWGHVGAFERMKQDGIDWDISVWHTYGQDPEWAFKILARYGRPIWVTEFNHPWGSQRGEDKQAEGLKRQMDRLRELQGTYKVEAAHIYELLDESYWGTSFEAFMGLVRLVPKEGGGWALGEPKPAYAAVREVIRGPRPLPRPVRNCTLGEGGEGRSRAIRQATYGYCLILGRGPEEGGLAGWTDSLEKGRAGVADMVLAMLRSDEFTRRYAPFGLTDKAYVNFLYALLLGREADPHGLASYVKELSSGSMTRAGIAYGIVVSSEFKSKHPALFTQPDAAATSQ